MSKEIHYLLLNTATNEREIHTASNARDLITNTKFYRLILKGNEADMKKSLNDPLLPVDTDENGKITATGIAQLKANEKIVKHETKAEIENMSEPDDSAARVGGDDDDLKPLKVLS